LTVFFLFLTAAIIFVIAYPELFITFKTSFALWPDVCFDYPLAFVLTNFFYQGGLQLWNFYGQMPFFHTYAVLGLFKFPNVMAAITYYLLAPFSGDSGRLFHHVFAWANLMTLLFIRVAGIFLLLKTVTRNFIILAAGPVVLGVFFSQYTFLAGVFWASYLPLVMYLIVRFFEGFKWRYLAALLMVLAVVLGSGVINFGYMYLPIHFFIIAGILWRFFFKAPNPSSIGISVPKEFLHWKMIGIILMAVLIAAPYAYILKFGFPDIAFGQASSRISHPFSPQWYFHNPDMDLGDPHGFFGAILINQGTDNLYYLGISFLFLAMAGLVLSPNTLKWFFALGIFFLWLLSFPREGVNLGTIAHWINALTNPLKTLPRSYLNICHSMLSYLLMSLSVMGIEAIHGLYKGGKYPKFGFKLLGVLTLLLVLNAMPLLPFEARVYLTAATGCLLGGLAWIYFKDSRRARRFLAGSLCLLAVIDVLFIVHQSKEVLATAAIQPAVLDAAPQSGMVEYDFENPSLFPYRSSYLLSFTTRDEYYLWFPHTVSSVLHHVINQGLNYVWLNGQKPRHVEFAPWLNDPQMLDYLKQNNEFIFLAQAAIKASPYALSRISQAGLARQVVEIEDPRGELNLPEAWPSGIKSDEKENFQYEQISGTLDDTAGDYSDYHLEGDLIIYTLHLPSSFPDHLASSWFLPEERYLRFFIEGQGGQWQELQAAQGALIRPNTFDVQNIKQGELRAAFSKDTFPMHQRCVLMYSSRANQGVEGLWRKQFDNLGIIYRAKRDGWLVGHYPYDTKFKISVDGKQVIFYRTNKSFIGFPLTRGEHKILIQYWPHSPLRVLLLVSALLTTLGLPVIIFLALRWEQGTRDE